MTDTLLKESWTLDFYPQYFFFSILFINLDNNMPVFSAENYTIFSLDTFWLQLINFISLEARAVKNISHNTRFASLLIFI